MGTLATAYSLAWLAVTLYVTWLTAQHRRLSLRIDDIQHQLKESAAGEPSRWKAA